MKKSLKIVIAVVAVVMVGIMLTLSACDLVRKVKGVELKFQKKVQDAVELSFDMHLEITDASGNSQLDISCYKNGDEYAYIYNGSGVVYRRLYADNKEYEFLQKSAVRTYYTTDDVGYDNEENVLYTVTQNIMLATYATLLTTGKKDKVGDVDTYRYDFSFDGNNYSLWYDDENLVKILAVINTSNDDGSTTTESYMAQFANYRFEDVDAAPFARPSLVTDGLESPISFQEWMAILNKFTAFSANWLK